MRWMSFEEFKSWASDNIIGRMAAEYENAEVKIHDVEKPGASYTGLTVRKKGQVIAATVDLDLMYSIYKRGEPEDKVLTAMAEKEMGEDFYIVPSSVNEMLLVPESIVSDPAELLRTHLLVSSQTEPSDRLSDRIFRFDHDSGKLVSAASALVS